MKNVLLLVTLIVTALTQTGRAQHVHTTDQTKDLLSAYYNLKVALIEGNTAFAATKAAEFAKVISDTDEKTADKAAKASLQKHADALAASKDLKSQRNHFSAVSEDIIVLAKTEKLSDAPIYQIYCPMKKSNWLSNEKTIKNPYYGSTMLTCGKVVATIK